MRPSGVPEVLSTDGGTQFVSHIVQEFLRAWGCKHRVSSAYFPHSNTRAELGDEVDEKDVERQHRGWGHFGQDVLQSSTSDVQEHTRPRHGEIPSTVGVWKATEILHSSGQRELCPTEGVTAHSTGPGGGVG